MLAIVDASAIYAAADRDDRYHRPCVTVLQRRDLELVIPALVVAEVCYMISGRRGALAEAAFLRTLEEMDVEAPVPEDWRRIAELVEGYADFPLGGTDASVVTLAERLDTDVIITLDRRRFGAVRPRHREAFHLLPD